jgi:8-oxo-dGTP pyrophosphatase MutT (NUDIX family)
LESARPRLGVEGAVGSRVVTRWTIHGETPLYSSEWLNLSLVDVELPDGTRFDHHVVRLPHPAAGVIVQDGSRVLLLRRHRFITDTWGWEIPAGRVDPGETLEQAAVREAIEETGWRPLDLDYLGFSHPTNGLMEQRFEYFVASRAEYVGDFERTETESIAWFEPEDVRVLIEQGEIPDGLSVTALGMAFTLGRL